MDRNMTSDRLYNAFLNDTNTYSGVIENNLNLPHFSFYSWLEPPRNRTVLQEWSEFLSQDLIQRPFETDKLATHMRSSDDVIWGAQNVYLNVMNSLLRGKHVAMLMEIATYENKGDPAITTGEVTLLRHLNVSVVFYCDTRNCTSRNLHQARNISRQYGPESLVVFLQGGGNLVGYEFSDKIRKRVLNVFPDFPVILFSQSIWIHEKNLRHLNACRDIYSNRPNLTMFIRDRQSMTLAQKYFKGTKLVLMPDAALCIGRVPRFMPPAYDILWLRRRDGESSNYQMPVLPSNVSVHVDDWWQWTTNYGTTPMETSILMTVNGLMFLQRGRVVITDRLHGHILSILSGTPHVLIDNPPFLKLSSFHRTWTAGLENAVIVTTGEDALQAALQLLVKYRDDLPPVLPYMQAIYRMT